MDSTVSGLQKQEARHRFFAVVTPGLEELLAEELAELGLDAKVTSGGAELSCGIEGLMRLCLRSRLVESVRLRLKAFRATDFAVLEHELARLPWHAYLRPGTPTCFSVTCHKSRLYHSDAVAERCQRVIETRLKTKLPKAPRAEAEQTVWLRITGDWVQSSIDASGERLHRRGYRTHVAEASIRETLAAAMVRLLEAKSGSEQMILWDPFCGSGTLILEWLSARRGLWPGAGRAFGFEAWPIFAPYEAMLAELRRTSSTPAGAGREPIAWGSDIDDRALAAARENARSLGVTSSVSWLQGDFAEVVSQVPKGALVLTNPPYGKRVGRHDDLPVLYRRFEKILRARPDLRPVLMACGLPRLRLDLPWQRVARIANGGLKVTLLRLER